MQQQQRPDEKWHEMEAPTMPPMACPLLVLLVLGPQCAWLQGGGEGGSRVGWLTPNPAPCLTQPGTEPAL